MSEHGLTPDEIKQRHAPEVITKRKTFETHGVSRQSALAYLDTPEGARFLENLIEADRDASQRTIADRAIELIRSGRDLPRMEVIDEPLVKAVPRGDYPRSYTPYFARESELMDSLARGYRINDHFGLPVGSEAPIYDVYRIDPKASAEVFVSRVAPTSELGGQVTRAGGAT